MLTIHLRINDAATGKPTPVRLRISDPDGAFYPPFGQFAEFATGRNEDVGGHLRLGREAWCHVDGSCEIKLPAGVPLRVQAAKGPEYRPLDETVVLGPGQMALRFTVERWSDVRADGWHPGDTRCHFIPPHAALLEAAAEDLDVVNLLACVQALPSPDGTAYLTAAHLSAFSGQAPALEAHGRMVTVNTLNTHPSLGRVGLLYSHRPVFPLTFGPPDDTDDWSVCDWCDQCHRKGGLTVWVDAFRPAGGVAGGEALVAAILGKIDAIELDARPRQQPVLPWVYQLWNAGFPVPLAGGSGKDSNRVPLGAMRTFARIGETDARPRQDGPPSAHAGHGPPPLSYKSWAEAVRRGRTFVTSGPLLSFHAGGHVPGTTVDRLGSDSPLPLRAQVRSLAAFDKLEIVVNGEPIASAVPERVGAAYHAKLEVESPFQRSTWVAARCFGGNGGVFAHTSPAVVRVDGQPLPRRPDAVGALARSVEQAREWVEAQGRFDSPKRKQGLLDRCREALTQLGAGG